MPPTREDLEFQRKIDEFAEATDGLFVPDPNLGRELLKLAMERIAARKRAA